MDSADASAHGHALELFADWLSRRERGEAVEFDALLRQYPALELELEELHATWQRLSQASEPSQALRSLHERIQSRFGKESLTQVSLREREDGSTPSDLSSALVAQLSAHSSRFGRYRIRGEVARGGMGAILKIWDEELRRHLAMKVILGQAVAPSTGKTPPLESSRVARFLEEAQVTGQLDHPGIVPVHELGLDPEGRLYFTMKLVKGESLHAIFEHVREGQDAWTQTRALNVLLKVCEAMAYAHDKGVIHRDLKPANVMVGKFGEVHVMDWGLARIEGQQDRKDIRIREEHPLVSEMQGVRSDRRAEAPDSPLCTMDGDVVGTPAYMPPEQAAGKVDEIGPHSDVYALGAMLYHLVAGHPPYLPRGVRLNNYAVWARVQEGPPKPLAQLAPQTPAELLAICDKAMERDWRLRYPDMSDLAEDLSAFLNQRVVRAHQTGTWAETRKWVQRNRSLAASLLAALLLLAGGLTASLFFKAQADAKEQLATGKANEVLSLSAIQDLRELESQADQLWPATPELLPKYESWMGQAQRLIDGSAADPARGVPARPSLAGYEAKLAALREHARPLTPEQIAFDRHVGTYLDEWDHARAQLQWMRRMLGQEPWPTETEVEAALDQDDPPTDQRSLNSRAFFLVGSTGPTTVYGSEVLGLVLARRALAAAKGGELTQVHDTLAWALYRCGFLEKALDEENLAIDSIPTQWRAAAAIGLARLKQFVSQWDGPKARAVQEQAAERLAQRIAELRRKVDERRTYDFDSATDRWWHTQLSSLVSGLRSLIDVPSGGLLSAGISAEYGWGIARRAEFARTIAERSVSGPEAKQRWDEARAAIAQSPRYGGLLIEPQLGLLPIGEDPDSHLFEFAHLQTGAPAVRGADGKLQATEEMGLVFVLIPGGTFWLGAQPADPSQPNYDPHAHDDEWPVRKITLSPYFLSKYEMTQGQFARTSGFNPSAYGPWVIESGRAVDLRHPVEQVSWRQGVLILGRLGLGLPSEAQWEYGARGGTDTPWWTGAERESLRGKVNIADQSARRNGALWSELDDWPDLDDGWGLHAPVGTYPANPYGLHEVLGNVAEWCMDGYNGTAWGKRLDPLTPWQGATYRVTRGGNNASAAGGARCAARFSSTPDLQAAILGLRPCRKLVVTP